MSKPTPARAGRRQDLCLLAIYVFFLFSAIAPLVAILFAGEEIALKVCAAGCLLLISASAATMITAVPTEKKR